MELRPVTQDEFEEFATMLMGAFHRELDEEDSRLYAGLFEPERSLAWFDDGRIVATTAIDTREIAVPGGVLPCAAVTAVGVRATHRRRGLLSGLMRRQLDDLHDGGEPLAALWASEAGIYGRFGYGIATHSIELTARRPAARLAAAPPASEALRAGPANELLDHARAVYERVRRDRPGMLGRDEGFWRHRLHDPAQRREGAQPLQAVGVDDGYALYAVRSAWDDDGPAGEVMVRELVAATQAGHAALWAFLLDQDLTRTVAWQLAPADEPLELMLVDPRAVRARLFDALWVRVVDASRALAGRSYATDADVVLELTDELCPWNGGRLRLDGERTTEPADLALDAGALGVAYLGGTTLRRLADAGRVTELRPGALAAASAAFRADVEPWCPEVF
jgi:predicted acetyltransferase